MMDDDRLISVYDMQFGFEVWQVRLALITFMFVSILPTPFRILDI